MTKKDVSTPYTALIAQCATWPVLTYAGAIAWDARNSGPRGKEWSQPGYKTPARSGMRH
jgi:hypothetical protein